MQGVEGYMQRGGRGFLCFGKESLSLRKYECYG
jgi:hypothetical protein